MARSGSFWAALVLGTALGAGATFAWLHEPPPDPGAGPTLAEQVEQLLGDIDTVTAERDGLRGELDAAGKREAAFTEAAAQRVKEMDAVIDKWRTQAAALQSKLEESASRLAVAESARDHLAAELTASQQEVAALQQNLAFFENLIPAGTKPGPVSIRSAQVEPDGAHLRYRVLIMRNGPSGDGRFKGSLRFMATGTRRGESATITLEPVASAPTSQAASERAAIPLEFQQYQRADGQLALPEDFVPESVTVRVLEGRKVLSEHAVGLTPKESSP
ncbi:hypothetical protein FOZ76_16700 [Verticiella sediminum]|uniref:Uncharacterized protein n=1 Tax=Verticiella sediminum TaxID=1247510 RepID=A0A556AJD9_9BURK|nr:DUF6776 family protein [Verticiella sediminum]TSH93024.1 hypothetical protein FOZ76_16700 [Verticiella sediminum]